MLDILKFAAITILFLRFAYWVGSSLSIHNKQFARVLLAQAIEGFLVLFFFAQFFTTGAIAPMQVSTGVQTIGFLLVCVGVGIAFAAKTQLGKEWVYASVYKSSPKEKLIINGIYAYIRHPIYTGIVVSYVGAELLAGSWLWVSMLCIYIPFFYQAQREEKFLMKKFGEKYKKYMQKTKMFLPYLW